MIVAYSFLPYIMLFTVARWWQLALPDQAINISNTAEYKNPFSLTICINHKAEKIHINIFITKENTHNDITPVSVSKEIVNTIPQFPSTIHLLFTPLYLNSSVQYTTRPIHVSLSRVSTHVLTALICGKWFDLKASGSLSTFKAIQYCTVVCMASCQ